MSIIDPRWQHIAHAGNRENCVVSQPGNDLALLGLLWELDKDEDGHGCSTMPVNSISQMIDRIIYRIQENGNRGIIVGGHGSPGFIEIGAGQYGPFNDPNKFFAFNNEHFWKEKFYESQIMQDWSHYWLTHMQFFGCHTGANVAGANFLNLICNYFNHQDGLFHRVLARPDLIWLVDIGGGKAKIYSETNLPWVESQVNSPALPVPIPYEFVDLKEITDEIIFNNSSGQYSRSIKINSVEEMNYINYKEKNKPRKSLFGENKIKALQNSFASPPHYYFECYLTACITGIITIRSNDIGVREFEIYNDYILKEKDTFNFYYTKPDFIKMLNL